MHFTNFLQRYFDIEIEHTFDPTCSDLHLKSTRPAFTPLFQPTLAVTSAGLRPTISANEPAFIRIDLHSIFTGSQ